MTGVTSPASVEVEKAEGTGFYLSRVLAIISAHFIHDTYSAFLAPLLPNLIEKLSLILYPGWFSFSHHPASILIKSTHRLSG